MVDVPAKRVPSACNRTTRAAESAHLAKRAPGSAYRAISGRNTGLGAAFGRNTGLGSAPTREARQQVGPIPVAASGRVDATQFPTVRGRVSWRSGLRTGIRIPAGERSPHGTSTTTACGVSTDASFDIWSAGFPPRRAAHRVHRGRGTGQRHRRRLAGHRQHLGGGHPHHVPDFIDTEAVCWIVEAKSDRFMTNDLVPARRDVAVEWVGAENDFDAVLQPWPRTT